MSPRYEGKPSTAMAARYQHVVDEVRRGVADQEGGLLWSPPLSGTANDGAAEGERPPPAAAEATATSERNAGLPCPRQTTRRLCWSATRGMRDSNPRGLAPNTLSKSDRRCSGRVTGVPTSADGSRAAVPDLRWTPVNECHEAGGLPPGHACWCWAGKAMSEGGRLSWCTSGWI